MTIERSLIAYRGAYVMHPSASGGADDAANMNGLLAEGMRTIALADGQAYSWRTPVTITTSGLVIFGAPGAGITAAMTPSPSAGLDKNIFYAPPHTGLGPATHLASGHPTAIGDTSIVVDSVHIGPAGAVLIASSPGADVWIRIKDNGLKGAIYRVVGVNAATKTISLDSRRPIQWVMTGDSASTVVEQVSGMYQGIYLLGRGTILQCANPGTSGGDAMAELYECSNSLATGWLGSGFSWRAIDFDVGGWCNYILHNSFDANGASTSIGFGLESNEGSLAAHNYVIGCTGAAIGAGLYCPSSVSCTWAYNRARQNTWGMRIDDGQVDDHMGSRCIQVIGGDLTYNAFYGLGVIDDSTDIQVVGVDVSHNQVGIYTRNETSGATGIADLRLAQIKADDCTTGIVLGPCQAGHGTRIDGLTTHRAAHFGIETFSDVSVTDWAASDAGLGFTNGGPLNVDNTAHPRVEVTGFRWSLSSSASAQWIGCYMVADSQVSLRHGTIDMPASGGSFATLAAFAGSTGTLRLVDVQTTGGDYGVLAIAGAAVSYGPGTDLSSAATPFSLSGGSTSDRPTFVATGTTPVVVAGYWPADALLDVDPVPVTSSSPGTKPRITARSANTATVVADSGDGSTYRLRRVA